MKRFFALCLVCTLVFLSSCVYKATSPYELMQDFTNEYCGTGTVYTPRAAEGEVGYVSDKIRKQLFTNTELIPLDYAIYMYSRVDTVTEVGMLSSVGIADKSDLCDMCLDRLDVLSSLMSGEGGVLVEGGVVIYWFSSERGVLEALKKIT